jgi:hypothetical protein
MIIILSTFAFYSAKGEGDPTLETDKTLYAAGETVIFTGIGYFEGSFKIEISYGESILMSLPFTPNETGGIPYVEWTIPDEADDGTYTAKSYNIITVDATTTDELMATTTFKVGLVGLFDELTGLGALVTSEVAPERVESLMASLSNADRKIKAAVALLEEGKSQTAMNQLRAARNMLTAFIHKVMAQSGKSIDEETANDLIERANAYIVYIDSMIVSTLISTGKQLALNVQRALAKQESNLARFLIRKGLAEAETDEEYLALANSTEAELQGVLNRIRENNRIREELWANRTIDFVTLFMGLQMNNETATNVRAAAELLLSELEAQNQTRPGLGKKLGQLMNIARGILTNSTETSRGMGQLMSKAKSQVHQERQHGQGAGKGNDGNGEKGNNGNKGNNINKGNNGNKGNKWNNGNHGNLGRRR